MDIQENIKWLESDFQMYSDILNGCGRDPLYSDGYNLNSIARRIKLRIEHLEKVINPQDYPAVLLNEIPYEVPGNYMVRAEYWRKTGKEFAEQIEESKEFSTLINYIKQCDSVSYKKDSVKEKAIFYHNRHENLKKAIQKDDLVYVRMRVQRGWESFYDELREVCRLLPEIGPMQSQIAEPIIYWGEQLSLV